MILVRHFESNFPQEGTLLELPVLGIHSFRLDSVSVWLHPEQRTRKNHGLVMGHVIRRYLQDNGLMRFCLDFDQGMAILSALNEEPGGVENFRRLFGENSCLLWRGVSKSKYGDLFVPFIFVESEKIQLEWSRVDGCFGPVSPSLKF